MKVKDLLAVLAELDPEAELILQKDAEGNGYSPLAGAEANQIYLPATTWSGEVYFDHQDLLADGHEPEEADEIAARPRVVVLYPIN
jgi:hypothetical protein